jgi:hypothetical protein
MREFWWKAASFVVEVTTLLILLWAVAYPTQDRALAALGSVAVAMGFQALRRKRLH